MENSEKLELAKKAVELHNKMMSLRYAHNNFEANKVFNEMNQVLTEGGFNSGFLDGVEEAKNFIEAENAKIEYELKISGSGTREQIVKNLETFLSVMKHEKVAELADYELEYPALIMEVKEIEK